VLKALWKRESIQDILSDMIFDQVEYVVILKNRTNIQQHILSIRNSVDTCLRFRRILS
jgi:hypothetical protein